MSRPRADDPVTARCARLKRPAYLRPEVMAMNEDRSIDPAPRLDPDDAGVGSVRPEEAGPLPANDQGLGSVRPEAREPLQPQDEGVGSLRDDEATGLAPGDEGVGSIRPDEPDLRLED
jgi:hypothetical protein